MWIPIWKDLSKVTPRPQNLYRKILRKGPVEEADHSHEVSDQTREVMDEKAKPVWTWISALLLGSAMVARGEIGLLIIEIGYNSTPYVSQEGFITGVWAILLNTIIGPIIVGVLVKFYGKQIGESEWGVQKQFIPGQEEEREHAAV